MAVLSERLFRVGLANGHQVLAHVPGRKRLDFIRLRPGDRVRLEMSPFDLSRGCIIGKES